ncbi:MAG: CDP-glucose 4,6-dehydratase [Lachnospiraceae bacterium]|nr:CDP-glucose 4,6-dehydratase [Lachnospiraceae bacterium]
MSILKLYKNKKVLITGHTGFKGSWLSYLLLNAGAEVTGFSLCPPTKPSLFEHLQLEKDMQSFVGDVADLEKLSKVFREVQPEIVLHLAAQPIVRESYRNPVLTYQTNVMGTVNVLECVRNSDSVSSVLNVTTDKVYKNREWEWGYRENEELCGFDPYSNSKSCSELVTYSYQNSFFAERDIAISTARAGNVIGGGDFATDRIIPDCFRMASKGEDIIVRNPGSIRPYQHVLEPLMAYLTIAAKQSEQRELAGNYNIGPDEVDCIPTGELVDLFCLSWQKYTGEKPVWINQSDGGPHEANFLKLDCAKFKKTFAWKPVWHIDKAVDQTVKWYCAYAAEDMKAVMKTQVEEFIKDAGNE